MNIRKDDTGASMLIAVVVMSIAVVLVSMVLTFISSDNSANSRDDEVVAALTSPRLVDAPACLAIGTKDVLKDANAVSAELKKFSMLLPPIDGLGVCVVLMQNPKNNTTDYFFNDAMAASGTPSALTYGGSGCDSAIDSDLIEAFKDRYINFDTNEVQVLYTYTSNGKPYDKVYVASTPCNSEISNPQVMPSPSGFL